MADPEQTVTSSGAMRNVVVRMAVESWLLGTEATFTLPTPIRGDPNGLCYSPIAVLSQRE